MQYVGVFQSQHKTAFELFFAPRQASGAANTLVPCGLCAVTVMAGRRRIEQHLLQTCVSKRCRNFLGADRIGKQVLNAFEAVVGRCGKALHEWQFVVQKREIGSKFQHTDAFIKAWLPIRTKVLAQFFNLWFRQRAGIGQ